MDLGVLAALLKDPTVLVGGSSLSLLGAAVLLVRQRIDQLERWKDGADNELGAVKVQVAELARDDRALLDAINAAGLRLDGAHSGLAEAVATLFRKVERFEGDVAQIRERVAGLEARSR